MKFTQAAIIRAENGEGKYTWNCFFPNEKAFGKLLANLFLPGTIDISAQSQHKEPPMFLKAYPAWQL
jgi:hypothetical protein